MKHLLTEALIESSNMIAVCLADDPNECKSTHFENKENQTVILDVESCIFNSLYNLKLETIFATY
jgi:hypothetical protein